MSASLVASLITGSGVAGIFLALLLMGQWAPAWVVKDKDKTISELVAANRAERDRSEAAVAAAAATRELLSALYAGSLTGGDDNPLAMETGQVGAGKRRGGSPRSRGTQPR